MEFKEFINNLWHLNSIKSRFSSLGYAITDFISKLDNFFTI